jgi:hypothetical protein
VLTVQLLEPTQGRVTAARVGCEGHFPRIPLWQSQPVDDDGPVTFAFDTESSDVRLGGRAWGQPSARRDVVSAGSSSSSPLAAPSV